jgi:hypothetical protein
MENRMKHFQPLTALALLLVAALACSLTPTTPTPASGDTVGTAVAATLTALAGGAGITLPAPGPTDTPVPLATLLPQSLYYLGPDPGGVTQVFRLDADGAAVHQLTSEPGDPSNPTNPGGVHGFDINLADSRLVYVANNQLIVTNPDGSGRTPLVDGGAITDATPFSARISSPVWVPDWTAIVFHYNGLSFYQFGSAAVTTVIPDQVDSSSGTPILNEGYGPVSYSPDGSKLLLFIQFYEAGTMGVYNPSGGSVTRFTTPDGGIIFGSSAWAPDSASVLVASQYLGYVSPGLDRFNASDGSGLALIGSPSDTDLNFVESPFSAPDGQLYYFFAHLGIAPSGGSVPLQMTRSAPDGVTGRTALRPETFYVLRALWAPDASFAIVEAASPDPSIYVGHGQLSLVYTDGRPVVPLPVSAAQDLRWGP